jgi:hypothetical protein
MAEATRRRWQDPEYRQRVALAIQRGKEAQSEESKAAQRAKRIATMGPEGLRNVGLKRAATLGPEGLRNAAIKANDTRGAEARRAAGRKRAETIRSRRAAEST